jgi:hypothetical protein
MTPVTLYVIPGIMPINRSSRLKEKDRTEIIRNKWRDFELCPSLDELHRNKDLINGNCGG